jgi:hypothetical protein
VTLLDTADVYGPHSNEELPGRGVCWQPEYVHACCDESLERYGEKARALLDR